MEKEGIAVIERSGPLQAERGHCLPARYEALLRVSRAISVYRDPKELFRVLADELRCVVSFDFVALFLYDPAANKVHNPVLEAVKGRGLALPADFPAEETITWWVYHHQEPHSHFR
jgi:GAF domain-containing protein